MKILMHSCCGPCSLMPLNWLLDHGHETTAFYFNPNIHPLAEYLRRRESSAQAAEYYNIPIIMADALPYEEQFWCTETENLSTNSLKGKDKSLDKIPPASHPVAWFRLMHLRELDRCELCWSLRLKKTAQIAKAKGFEAISTSLLYSRYQNHEKIKELGKAHAKSFGMEFIYYDFREFWQKGIELSKSMDMYRQPYCGCIFSEYARYSNKISKKTGNNLAHKGAEK